MLGQPGLHTRTVFQKLNPKQNNKEEREGRKGNQGLGDQKEGGGRKEGEQNPECGCASPLQEKKRAVLACGGTQLTFRWYSLSASLKARIQGRDTQKETWTAMYGLNQNKQPTAN